MKDGAKEKISPLLYFLMLGNFIIYSLVLVMSSWGGQFPLLSQVALGIYALAVILLGIYAIIWQQILKYIPLTTAYSCKSITVIFGMLWGTIFFEEAINIQMIIGALLVICGTVLVAWK